MARRKSAASSRASVEVRDQPSGGPAKAPVEAARAPLQDRGDSLTMNQFLARQSKLAEAKQAKEQADEQGAEPAPDLATVLAETAPTPDKGGTGEGETPTKPRTLKALAELAELEVSDLYELEIPLEAVNGESVGKTVTLGQLKDAQNAQADLETRTAVFEETKTKSENELLRAKAQLQEIVAALPAGSVKPELIAKMNAETERWRTAESERLAEAIPEWGDDAKREADRAVILEHLSEYGYGAEAFDGIVDHRMVKYVRDSALRYRRMTEALKKVEERKPKPPASASKPASPKPKGNARPAPGQNLSPAQLRTRFNLAE